MEKTQYRIDHAPFRKCYNSPEGYLYAEATFARDGILEYSNADGTKRRELRLPEENKKALTGFGRKPFTIEHPSILVNANNSKQLSVGLTDPEVVYDKSGFVRGVITVTDSAAVELIRSGQKPEVSVGYQCRLEKTPGVWQGERYDAIQRDIVVNHVCCTAKGRAGGDVRIHLDSETEDSLDIAYLTDSLDKTTPTGGRMATLTIDNATYDVPAELAPVITNQLSKLDSLKEEVERLRSDNKEMKTELKEAQGRVDSLSEELVEAIDRADTQEGRADRFEEIVDDSLTILSEEGYQWNGDSATFVREDGKGMKGKMPWMKEADPEEEDMDDDEEEDEQMPASYKGKKKKQDGCETPMKQDSVEEIVAAILEAEAICPGIRQDSDLSTTSVRSIQEMVISRLDADYDLTEASDGYVAGVYFALTQNVNQDADEDVAPSYAQQAMRAVTTSAPAPRQDAVETFAGASGARMAAGWQKPLN